MARYEKILQEIWYEKLPSAFGLHDSSFNYVSVNRPLNIDSEQDIYTLNNMLVPLNEDVTLELDLSHQQGFFEVYREMVEKCIQWPSSDEFKRVLGDAYSAWKEERSKLSPDDNKIERKVLEAFDNWAQFHIDSGRVPRAKTALRQEFENPVAHGLRILEDTDNFTDDGRAKFSPTIHEVVKSIADGERISVEREKGGCVFKVEYKKMVTFNILRKGWYNAATSNYAKETNDNTVWIAGAPLTWEDVFGTQGKLKKEVSGFVLVDGLEATISVPQADNTSEFVDSTETSSARILSTSGRFFSVFFEQFNIEMEHDDNNIHFFCKAPEGNPALLGVNIISN